MEIIFDKTGFPMVRVNPENFWIHVWPVTKIQFENFLCDQPNSEMDANWYQQILSNNPRITPSHVTSGNYWQLFVAGIHPEKVKLYDEWCGRGFSIPTSAEWYAAYSYFSRQETVIDLTAALAMKNSRRKIDPFVKVISQKLSDISLDLSKSRTTSLADQFLMRGGMVEWVKLTGESTQWGGLGEPSPLSGWNTTAIVYQGRAEIVRNLNVRHYGFRLIKRDKAV